MASQQLGQRLGGVRTCADQAASAVLERDAGLQGLPNRTGTTAPGRSVFGAPDPTMGSLIDSEIRDSTHGVRRVCIDTYLGRFAALVAGRSTPSRPTVLFTAGLLSSKEDFSDLLQIVAANGFRAVAYDQRGQSGTPLIQGAEADADVRLDDHAADVRAIADALGCRKVHFVGHSFAGFIGRAAALAHPERIASLTLLSSGPCAVGEPFAEKLRLLRWALQEWPPHQVYEAVRTYWPNHPCGWPCPVVDAAREEFLRRRFLSNSTRALEEAINVLLTATDQSDELRDRGLRILVAHGSQEPYWRAPVQRDMARRLNARLVEIPDAKHSPHQEKLDDTAAALLTFLTDADPAYQPTPFTTGAVPAPSGQHRPGHDAALPCSKEQSSAA